MWITLGLLLQAAHAASIRNSLKGVLIRCGSLGRERLVGNSPEHGSRTAATTVGTGSLPRFPAGPRGSGSLCAWLSLTGGVAYPLGRLPDVTCTNLAILQEDDMWDHAALGPLST